MSCVPQRLRACVASRRRRSKKTIARKIVSSLKSLRSTRLCRIQRLSHHAGFREVSREQFSASCCGLRRSLSLLRPAGQGCRHHRRPHHRHDRPGRLDRHPLCQGGRGRRRLQGRGRRHQNQTDPARRRHRSVERHAQCPQTDRAGQSRCADGLRQYAELDRDHRGLPRAESPVHHARAGQHARRARAPG